MEKLIELLNEYSLRFIQNKYLIKWEIGEEPVGIYGYVRGEYGLGWASKLVIISKEFGFIKWLVENDKIDTDAYKTVYSGDLDKRKTLTMSSGGDEFYQVTEHGVYESLLMLLSISSSPIEDLISYLK